jgi:hypothetical protein
METLRSVAEIAIGVIYGVGAAFNTVYTLRHSAEFYGDFADGAWFPPARWFIRRLVIPNGTVVTVLVILFQVTVAVAILSRGDLVTAALYTGATFALVVAFFSSPRGAVGNVALAALQFGLAVTR